jgi:hypothetical protein
VTRGIEQLTSLQFSSVQRLNEMTMQSFPAVSDNVTAPDIPEAPVALYVVIGILLTAIGLLALAVTVRCTGVDYLFVSHPHGSGIDNGSSTVGRFSSRQQRRNGRRSAPTAASATKKLMKASPGEKMRFCIPEVGRTTTAIGGDVSAADGGTRGGSSTVGGAKSNRQGPAALSDSSPGTERTVSEAACPMAVCIGNNGVYPIRSPLLLAASVEDHDYVVDNAH